MKKLFFLMLVLLITINVFGQSDNVSTTVYTTFYRDTLTTSIDTMDIKFQSGFDYYTISVYTTTGTDTINVYSKGEGDYGLWAQKALIDLSSNALVTQIIITTTVKEYLVQDPGTMWIRLITPDASASSVFTINAKKGQYAINTTRPLTSADVVGLAPFTSGGYGNFSVSTVDTLSGTSIPCARVELVNNTSGSTLYIGFNGSLTSSNGYAILNYRDSIIIPISNLNKVYLLGSTTVDVRYIYYNF